jgi:FkbM family methyltransferase
MADLIEGLFLKYSSKASGLRRVPGLGAVARRLSYRALPPDRRTWLRVREGPARGLWLKLHPRTARECLDGESEPALQEVLAKHLRPGMVFYDLGANVGFFTLLAARLVGMDGSVYSFEADPEMAQRLQENVEKNEFRNVRVVQKAVWSSTGSVTFNCADESQSPDRGWGKVVSSPAPAERTLRVASIALDDFARTEAPPDFVKCDVEGAEAEVFTDAHRVLAHRRPLVACEVHSGQNAAQLTQLFERLRYSLSWFTERHFLACPRALP